MKLKRLRQRRDRRAAIGKQKQKAVDRLGRYHQQNGGLWLTAPQAKRVRKAENKAKKLASNV